MELELARQIFEKFSNITFHVISASGNRIVPRGKTDT